MNKQIILQEADFNDLKVNADLWIKHKKDKTRFIKFNITLDRRYIDYGYRDFEMLFDGEVPESLKIYLETFIRDLNLEVNSLKEKQSEIKELKTQLNKIPKWIKSIFK